MLLSKTVNYFFKPPEKAKEASEVEEDVIYSKLGVKKDNHCFIICIFITFKGKNLLRYHNS